MSGDRMWIESGHVYVLRTVQPPTVGERFAVWSATSGVEMLLGAVALIVRVAWNVSRAGARCAVAGVRAGVRHVRSTHDARVLFDGAMLLLWLAAGLAVGQVAAYLITGQW